MLEGTDHVGRISEGLACKNVLVTFLGVVIKCPTRSNQRQGEFILTRALRTHSILAGKCGHGNGSQLWLQEHEAVCLHPHGSGNKTGSGAEL